MDESNIRMVGMVSPNQSETVGALAAALAKAQGEISDAITDSANPFFKSKYADLHSVISAIKEPLSKHGLAYVQAPDFAGTDEVTLVTTLMHSSGEWVKSRLTMKPQKNDPQGIGSVITYARRYSLAAIAGIAQQDDDAESATVHSQAEKTKVKKLPAYPQESFDENFPLWEQAIQAGKKTPKQIIAVIQSKATLAPAMVKKINGVKKAA